MRGSRGCTTTCASIVCGLLTQTQRPVQAGVAAVAPPVTTTTAPGVPAAGPVPATGGVPVTDNVPAGHGTAATATTAGHRMP